MELKFIVLVLFQIYNIGNAAIYGDTIDIKTYEPLFAWRQIDYVNSAVDDNSISYSSPYATTDGGDVHDDYIRYNNFPMGTTRWNEKIFLTIPRRRTGIPATLNYIIANKTRTSNLDVPLIPYPNLEMNRLEPRTMDAIPNIVSVYRTTADICDRLWLVDTGMLEYEDIKQKLQQPAIIVIDLHTDRVLHRYEIPDHLLKNDSLLASIAVDVRPGSCDDTFAYMPDGGGYGLIVFDLKKKSLWKFNHNSFFLDPLGGNFNINGLEFQWNDGIFSIALGSRDRNGYRTAYYHAMASTHEFSVSTRVLRNETLTKRSFHDFVHLGNKGDKQQASTVVYDHETGVLFFALVNNNGLACWNTKKPFNTQEVLFQDNERFIYPSDITNDRKGNIWVMTNTMPFLNYRSLNPEEINFRIWVFKIKELIANTNCA